MPSTSTTSNEGPEASCCLGVAYWNRTMERAGTRPKCLGLGQFKRGEQDGDDVRELSSDTQDFKYYCVGYSSHPSDSQQAQPGHGPTKMPYCEGIEIAVTEERVLPAPMPGAGAAATGTLLRDRAPLPSLDLGDGAGAHPPAAAPSDSEENKSVQARFRKNLWRNVDLLSAAVTGEKLPQLPVQLKTYTSVEEARQTLVDTASTNLLKMRAMAEFISCRTLESAKPIWERFRPSEETD